MAYDKPASAKKLLELVVTAGPSGITPEALERDLPATSRSTINRRLAALVLEGRVKSVGAGRAVRYLSAAPFAVADIARYLAIDWQSRPVVSYKEALLAAAPNIDPAKALRLQGLTGLAGPLDRKFLSNFLIDFSWGSSVLKGGTY